MGKLDLPVAGLGNPDRIMETQTMDPLTGVMEGDKPPGPGSLDKGSEEN